MKFIDLNDDRIYTLTYLWKDWKAFREDDPINHAESFQIEMLEILMATINGRNDLQIIGMTPKEISRLTLKLLARFSNKAAE